MPRFVLLEHDHPFLHLDLMLEAGTALRTWRLAGPLLPGAEVELTPLPDHRLAYLDYEGPVSGNRGQVRRLDAGSYLPVREDPGGVVVWLEGEKSRGLLELLARGEGWVARLHPPSEGRPEQG